MSRMLLLIRHAKAGAGEPRDELRELAARGEADARAAGRWLVDHDLMPSHVVVSTARRAQQTWAAVATAISVRPSLVTDARIYDNTVESLLAVIHEAPVEQVAVALVGHNPSMHELAVTLDDGAGDPAARAEIASSYPTCGIAAFAVAGEWSDLEPGAATLRSFVAPRG